MSSSYRTCSYCGDRGHNRRTCTVLEQDKQIANVANHKFRKLIATQLNNIGIVPGALLMTKKTIWDSTKEPAIFTKINWDRVGFNFPMEKSMVLKNTSRINRRSESWRSIYMLPQSLNFPSRTHDPESRYEAGVLYVSSEHLMPLLAPGPSSSKFVDSDYAPNSKNMATTYRKLNIKPASYRQEDKRRKTHVMGRLKKFIDNKYWDENIICI